MISRTARRTSLPTASLVVTLILSAMAWAANPQPNVNAAKPMDLKTVVARVNGAPITELEVRQQMEFFYPSNQMHGGLRPEKLKEIRSKAATEVVIEELIWADAVRRGDVVPMAQVRAEYRRLRAKYGAKRFDAAIQASGSTTAAYLNALQRRMTLERVYKSRIYLPSRVTDEQMLAYYKKHLEQFRRPEQVHAYLFLAAAGKDAPPDQERAAKEKADKVYQQLRAGKSFEELAEQYSDDKYRIMGGDLGMVHKGLLEPQFENVAFGLKPGEFSPVFRTDYGFNIMKITARDPGRLMKFSEVKAGLKARLEKERLEQRRAALTEVVRKNAKIEVLDPTIQLTLAQAAPAAQPAPTVAAH